MAGRSGDFPAAEFRREIRSAMMMGLPNAATARPTFRWDERPSYASGSSSGVPFNLAEAPVTTATLAEVQVPVAVELLDAGGAAVETPVANFHADAARLTFLDVDWAKVVVDDRPFDTVLLDGNVYHYDKQLPTGALFDVDVIQVLVVARDES